MKRYLVVLLLLCSLTMSALFPQNAQANNIEVTAIDGRQKGTDKNNYWLNFKKRDLLIGNDTTVNVSGLDYNEDISFKSSDSSIVSIEDEYSDSCSCVARSSGTATITVRIKKGGLLSFLNSPIVLSCKIKVTPRAVSIKFKKSSYRLTQGSKKKLAVILRPSITKEKAFFLSSNPSVAKVGKNGNVTAKSEGTAYIYASIQNGQKVHCKITVRPSKK